MQGLSSGYATQPAQPESDECDEWSAAIVGLGRWGRNLVQASLGHERLKIVRAVEPDIKGANDFCAEHHLELTGNLDAVLC